MALEDLYGKITALTVPAGAGTAASNGSAAATPTVVQAPNGVIQGIDRDAVIKGTVTIQ